MGRGGGGGGGGGASPPSPTMGLIGCVSAVSKATLQLRFAVHVGIIIVRASRGQRSLHLPHQQFLKKNCSQDCCKVESEFWLASQH